MFDDIFVTDKYNMARLDFIKNKMKPLENAIEYMDEVRREMLVLYPKYKDKLVQDIYAKVKDYNEFGTQAIYRQSFKTLKQDLSMVFGSGDFWGQWTTYIFKAYPRFFDFFVDGSTAGFWTKLYYFDDWEHIKLMHTKKPEEIYNNIDKLMVYTKEKFKELKEYYKVP